MRLRPISPHICTNPLGIWLSKSRIPLNWPLMRSGFLVGGHKLALVVRACGVLGWRAAILAALLGHNATVHAQAGNAEHHSHHPAVSAPGGATPPAGAKPSTTAGQMPATPQAPASAPGTAHSPNSMASAREGMHGGMGGMSQMMGEAGCCGAARYVKRSTHP